MATKELDPIEETVAELWYVGIGINDLLQKVQERLKDDESIEVTKKKVKTAKLIIPYSYNNHQDKGDANSQQSLSLPESSQVLSEEKIKFVNAKIVERQNYRKLRKFKDADYIQRGLDKMGIVLDEANKTWFYQNKYEGINIEERHAALLDQTNGYNYNANDDNNDANDNKSPDGIRCVMCNEIFESRNLLFKHLRDPGSSCGNAIFSTNQSLEVAPSIKKKTEKKKKEKNASAIGRRRTGKTAQHASSSSTVWIGDIPLPWTRVGGKYKRLRALLREYLPREIPQPWVKIVVRKAYRKHSEERKDGDNAVDNDNEESKIKDEYLGYAIVVCRCDEEAEHIRKFMDGLEVLPNQVFQSTEMMNDKQLAQIPAFILKVRAAENGDSSTTLQTTKSGLDPPLSEQLRPFTIDELEKRINETKMALHRDDIHITTETKTNEGAKDEKDQPSPLNQHDQILQKAVSLYRSIGPRKEIRSEGKSVPETIRKPLIEILKSLRWQVPNERRHLTAERYLVLPTNISNDRFYGDLRQACKNLMEWADKDYFYSGIAVTKNFVSSPHIDDRDQSYQYAISLGDFNGGELCVEGRKYNEENDTFEDYVNVVNTRNRIARVEGRHIHWVRSWEGGDRYSLIFYDTTDQFRTPIIESGVCSDYLKQTD